MIACPVCERSDAMLCKDDPKFYRDGKLWARCLHRNTHPNGGSVDFYVETGEILGHIEQTPAESLYHIAQSGPAHGFGAAFLAEKCGIYVITKEDVSRSNAPVPTEKWMLNWDAQKVPVTITPLYKGAALVGLEVRAMAEKASPRHGEAAPKTDATRKTVGDAGVYITSTRLQPFTVVVFTGVWDAVSAAWDALQNGSDYRYAFASVPDGFNPIILRDTLETIFPGVPRLIVSDQDGSGQKARKRFARVGTLAILPGVGLAKDYRDADPKKRWSALLQGIERALDTGNPSQQREDTGIWRIARRAILGTLAAKKQGHRDLEAWRFGQRCAGIVKANPGGRKFFSIRANLYGRLVTAEGQHDFEPILSHRAFADIERDYPDLAAVIRAGATEHSLSPQWRPPVFLEDGRHWSEIPADKRKAFARDHGWEPWTGRDPGKFLATDLEDAHDSMRRAYLYTRMPGAPDSEVGLRMLIWCLATALCALKSEELWIADLPTGFLPWVWFYGGPATGKGIAMKIVAACLTGELRTFGSQRFGGEESYDWLTESVLHLPICFRDELDCYIKNNNLEDLKTFLAGEALQLRKKFGTDMTVSPRPVVIASNEMRVNQDDEATIERIILVQLDPNPLASKQERNNAFETFHEWLEVDGKDLLYRLTLGLYKEFRSSPIGKSVHCRSAMMDSAVAFVARKMRVSAAEIFRPSVAGKDEAVLHGAAWYARLVEYLQHEIGVALLGSAKVTDVWGLSPNDPNQKRTLYRYMKHFQNTIDPKNKTLLVGCFTVKLGSYGNNISEKYFIFERCDPDAISAQSE